MSTFEIVRGVEGDCLVLDNTRICGPKPWGGGHVIKTFHTDGVYEVIDKDEYRKLQAENAKLRELVEDMYACISHANEQDWFYFERDKFGCGMSCTVNGEACGLRTLADRMRELFGKENDGCDLV